MKDFKSIYGEREYGKGGMIYASTKEDIRRSIQEKYSESSTKILKLFEDRTERVSGWLVFTKSRIIFYLQQDMNRFRDYERIVWVIDEIYLSKFKLILTDENEIEILPNKKILFSRDLHSSGRLIKEIKSQIIKDKLFRPFSFFKSLSKSKFRDWFFNKNFWLNPYISGTILIIIGLTISYLFSLGN